MRDEWGEGPQCHKEAVVYPQFDLNNGACMMSRVYFNLQKAKI